MLAQMPGKTDQLSGQLERQRQRRIRRVEAEAAHRLLRHALARPAPDLAGQRTDRVLAQPHGLADLAHGAAGAVADHRRGQTGAVAAVLPIDVLDDLLAALMLEIDVDVRRLVAFGRDEALEQQIEP